MFTDFMQTQRALMTVIVFLAAYFAALTIGRLLKRRQAVRPRVTAGP